MAHTTPTHMPLFTDAESLPPLSDVVQQYLSCYFDTHADSLPEGRLHEYVVAQTEKPLIALVLELTQQNQSRAAALLGINRNTLHKKMVIYGMAASPTAARVRASDRRQRVQRRRSTTPRKAA